MTHSGSSDDSIAQKGEEWTPVADLTGNAIAVLERRYLKKNDVGEVIETPQEMYVRVAQNIAHADGLYDEHADIEKTAKEFYKMMTALEFVPNSPTLMNAGRDLQQLSACFVLPIEDSMESIFQALKDTALIHKSGGGTGFSFSALRPKNDVVLSTKGVSSGPVSFMGVFNAATEAVKQGGTRRGANMAILRVDHPDILQFITSKRDNTAITNFNISVGLTEDFMDALQKDGEYELINPRDRKVSGKMKAKEIFDLIVDMAWTNGEPGIIFLDRLNEGNPTPELGVIESTNPCGEQPLLPYESCNLGSINLSRMVVNGGIDWGKLKDTVHKAVHFLDNVIDMNSYPLETIEEMTQGNRKIGLGVMGFADLLIMLGIRYDSQEATDVAEKAMSFVETESRKASVELARTRGVFPNFTGSIFDVPGGERVRNATTTTIAPTGTISIIAGCSGGIEPLFAVSFIRTVMDDDKLIEVNPLFKERAMKEGFYSEELMKRIADRGSVHGMDDVPDHIQKLFVTAHDVSPEWHIGMQAAFQRHTHNAVSKTVNFPNSATREDISRVYRLAYDLGCKGVTVYRDGSRDAQVLSTGQTTKSKEEAERKLHPRPRPSITMGSTIKMRTGCGTLYVTINEDEHGVCEVFSQMGKSGGCAMSQSEAVARLISLALRSGVRVEPLIRQIKGIRCPSPLMGKGGIILSCPDAVGKALERYMKRKQALEAGEPLEEATTLDRFAPEPIFSGNVVGVCPDCGAALVHEGGCMVCRSCGYSKCG
ncbi:MAG: vitamin B12-dependent ribonucleotide reductase [Candidatus Thermoplasmatota archaeon]|nr:vitamin B12-dependent ribonucleotide reductase [Candidatus Thermoplasmatota archaeon]